MNIKIILDCQGCKSTIEGTVGGVDLGLLARDPEQFHKVYILPHSVAAANSLAEAFATRKGVASGRTGDVTEEKP